MCLDKKVEYQVWILGYNDDDIKSVNDYTKLVARFEDYEIARWFVLNYEFFSIAIDNSKTERANVVIEKTIIEDDGSETCDDVLLEEEIF